MEVFWSISLALMAMVSSHPGHTEDFGELMHEDGATLPDLTGVWESDSRSKYTLRRYQPSDQAAVPHNSTYLLECEEKACGRCRLSALYDYDTRTIVSMNIQCEGVQDVALVGSGVLDGPTIQWEGGSVWTLQHRLKHASNIHTVHMIFMNHYDVGYTGFVNDVDNTYMHKYFPLAARTAQEMRDKNSSDSFIYTTHSWLMKRFLECACPENDPSSACPARSLNNAFSQPLKCPSDEELATFEAAARKGDIVWHAAPFNIQPENMSPELFSAGIDMVRQMDKRFYNDTRITTTMSIRDVIYVTRSVIPMLSKRGIKGVTIGSNGADYPPQVPKLHRWLDPSTQTDVVVAYHPYGYGGYGPSDCAESPNGFALCTEFRTDNTGPPSSTQEVIDALNKVRTEYPNAVVKASTFDAFIADVLPAKDQLPVINLEVGDSWMYGTPSDPLKMAQNRAVQRAWIECLAAGEPACSPSNPAIQNMTWFLLKAPEHTWGTPGISGWGGGDDYDAQHFRKDLQTAPYMKAAASWAEQRFFNELAVRALEEQQHPLAQRARFEMKVLEEVREPDPNFAPSKGFVKVPLGTIVTSSATGVKVGLGKDGSITSLIDGDVQWASSADPLAAFVYQTFNETEWKPFTYAYCNDHQEQAGFSKPGSNNYSESAIWRPVLTDMWVLGSASAAGAIVARMVMPEKSAQVYGAPASLWVNLTFDRDQSGSSALDIKFATIGKQPTMIGEASLVTFKPAPALQPLEEGSAWRIDKLGGDVDPEGVQDGGNQYNHGSWKGTRVNTVSGTLTIESLDAVNMNPMTDDFPIGNPLPASYLEASAKAGKGLSRLAPGSVKGMAVNLHNNLWNTNYPLYYPYFDPRYCSGPLECRNRNALWRFKLVFSKKSELYV